MPLVFWEMSPDTAAYLCYVTKHGPAQGADSKNTVLVTWQSEAFRRLKFCSIDKHARAIRWRFFGILFTNLAEQPSSGMSVSLMLKDCTCFTAVQYAVYNDIPILQFCLCALLITKLVFFKIHEKQSWFKKKNNNKVNTLLLKIKTFTFGYKRFYREVEG